MGMLNPTFPLKITLKGDLIGKQRARGKNFHTPTKTRNAEISLEGQIIEQIGCPKLMIPLSIRLIYTILPPKSWNKSRRQAALDGLIYPVTKPDIDNVEKLICDAANGIIWLDDAQISRVYKDRSYSSEVSATLEVEPLPYKFEGFA